MGARRDSSQASTVRIPGPPVLAWAAIVAAIATGLLTLAALVGTRAGGNQPVDVLPVVGDSIEEALRGPAVAAFLAALFLVLLVGAVRGARLRWLAQKPGPVDVADLKSAGSVPEGTAERLTLHFRQRLADLHLATPGPQPGITPATGFVDLIGSATRDSNALFATVAGLLRVAWPSQAYQVQATLVQDDRRGCGVSVQVVMLPASTTPPTTCWAASWEMAIDRAANRAAAFILPRTGVCRRSPWVAWQGYVLPPQLLEAYERAAVCTHERRYDEALREYYRALKLDPKNLEVRLRIGFVQEKLGLALDALSTYQATCEMTSDCPKPGVGTLAARALLRARRRSQAIASYRRAVLLGSAEGLSKQWCAPDGTTAGTRRDEQRRACRERLRPMLMKLCVHEWDKTEARRHTTLKELLSEPEELPDEPDELARRRTLLCEVFQLSALDVLNKLETNLPRGLTGGDDRSLTPTAIALSKHCVQLRLRTTRQALGTRDSEPLKPARLDDWVSEAGLVEDAPWSERYSAASLYALGMSGDPGTEANQQLAEKAVKQLEHAIESADSGYVASRRSWLVSEDPDFDLLRLTPRFQRFEATYFPSHHPTSQRPRGAHQWEVVEYVHQLIADCARHRENGWRAQVLAAPRDGEPDGLASLWHEELKAWELVSELASNCEHWQTRLKLVDARAAWTAGTEGDMALGYPDYADVVPDRHPLSEAINDAHSRLDAVHALADRQRAELEAFAGDSPAGRRGMASSPPRARRSTFVQHCHDRIVTWEALADTLKPRSPSQPALVALAPDAAHAGLNGGHRRLRWRPAAASGPPGR